MAERRAHPDAAAGAFWEPMARRCAAPVHLYHAHGSKDRLVPFEGREVRFGGIDFTQGNVMKALDLWRRQGGCMTSAENEIAGTGMFKRWTGCDEGSITLELAPGGHAVPKGWRGRVIDWFERLE